MGRKAQLLIVAQTIVLSLCSQVVYGSELFALISLSLSLVVYGFRQRQIGLLDNQIPLDN